ncbi:MAG: molybdate ABC transporter substrate-binding protein [Paracoccaceae bacterium]
MAVLAVAVTHAPTQADEMPVTIFAAASLKPALDAILSREDASEIQVSYGGSSALARQIQHGAPVGIFISANQLWMDTLQSEGFLTAGTRVDFLGNRLVLIARTSEPEHTSIALALGHFSADDHLAMGLVKAVPAGIYGKEALVSLGLWPALKSSVVQTDNVRSALRFVASGEVRFGIVYTTDTMSDVQVVGQFPEDSHSPIRYPIAMIGEPDDLKQRVYDLLLSPQALQTFSQFGFQILADRQ